MNKIQRIQAITVFDSRGYPTIECQVMLDNGVTGRAMVPSGASTGTHEALELRDGDPAIFGGKSVSRAIRHIFDVIQPELTGLDIQDQEQIDQRMIELDGTPDKSRLGANAILAVSMACVRTAARTQGVPLFRQLAAGTRNEFILPLPEIQIIGGGAHSAGSIDIQDYMVICPEARSLMECYQITFDIYRKTGEILKSRGKLAGVADEGGFWPAFTSNEEGLLILTEAIEKAGYRPGIDVAISLDLAASEFYQKEGYHLRLEDRLLSTSEYREMLENWLDHYPVCSVEDPFSEEDPEVWNRFTQAWTRRIQIVGDDLFVTNPERLVNGIERKLANSILIKLNQIGTVSETKRCVEIAKEAGWRPVVSARSGETEDTFIAHLAVATGAGQLKVGSFTRSERMAKWNELLRIEHQLQNKACYAIPTISFPWESSQRG
jgi:enolase